MKLIQLYSQVLQEIGEGSSKPFPFEVDTITKGRSTYDIMGETSKGEKVTITLSLVSTIWDSEEVERAFEYDSVPKEFYMFLEHFQDEFLREGLSLIDVTFLIKDSEVAVDDPFSGEVNDTQYMFRLMATLKKILLVEIRERKVNVISFSPSESSSKADFGEGRYRLYKLFIKKAFPNAKEYRDDDMLYFYIGK